MNTIAAMVFELPQIGTEMDIFGAVNVHNLLLIIFVLYTYEFEIF